jgi:UDP-N-acetylglucosamine 2-epimerase (non-hydrolysing)
MKVMTILGTRPEIIRLSLIIGQLDRHCEHILVHTGQNYEESLSDIFLKALNVRTPDVHLGIRSASFGEQISQILLGIDSVLEKYRPDRVLILGDTNSALSAIVAARRGIPVFHLEAGNRCYDDRVPEEVNRRIIDHASAVLMPYTHRSKENLLREGIERDRIFVIGNPIYEVLRTFAQQIEASDALARLGVVEQRYFLVTLHRSENVDQPQRLASLVKGLAAVSDHFALPMLVSVHPRTRHRLEQYAIKLTSEYIQLLDPLGFFDFVKLERHAFAVLSDSGTVQEECAIFNVPNVTIRDVTERPETLECGSNLLSGALPESVLQAVQLVVSLPRTWKAPDEYVVEHVTAAVLKIVLGYVSLRQHQSVIT